MTTPMRAAVYHGPGQVALEIRDVPRPTSTDVLVQVRACGVCGTDVHIMDGHYPAAPGSSLGHEFAGVVVEVGAEVAGLVPGDPVAVDPNIACGRCPPCRRGDVHLCQQHQAIGVTCDGGFAEMCLVPAAQAYRLPHGFGFEHWAFAEPLSCCVHGLDLAGIRIGESVVVLGAGAIGLIMVQLARAAGAAFLLASDPVPAKRELALQLGADEAVDPTRTDLAEALYAGAPEGVGVVLECVGKPETALKALQLARPGGTVVWFGVSPPGSTIPVEPYTVYRKELTIRGAFTNPHTFARAVAMLVSGRVRTEWLISHRFELSAAGEAVATVRRGQAIKALVLPQGS